MIKRKRMVNYHEQIIELAKTCTLPEISKQLDVSKSSLNGYMQKHKISCVFNRNNLSEHHDRILELVETGMNTRKIAQEINVDRSSLDYHLKKHNIKMHNGKFTVQNDSELMDKIVNLHSQLKTYEEIRTELGVSSGTVGKVLDIRGVTKLTTSDSYRSRRPLNEAAFKDFNNELAAYWYGWLLTDGSISDVGTVSLGLQGADVDIIQKFADYIGVKTEIKVKTYFHKQLQRNVESASFAVKDDLIAQRLTFQGLEPRKSCKEKLPKFDWLYGESAAHFWRACLEGDGHIRKDLSNCSVCLIGGEELLNGFKKYAEVICGVKEGKPLVSRTYGDPNFRTVTYCGTDSRKILRKLWSQGSVFLERKRLVVEAQLAYHSRDIIE